MTPYGVIRPWYVNWDIMVLYCGLILMGPRFAPGHGPNAKTTRNITRRTFAYVSVFPIYLSLIHRLRYHRHLILVWEDLIDWRNSLTGATGKLDEKTFPYRSSLYLLCFTFRVIQYLQVNCPLALLRGPKWVAPQTDVFRSTLSWVWLCDQWP